MPASERAAKTNELLHMIWYFRLSGHPLRILQVIFAVQAMGMAVWVPRIPEIKAALQLDYFALSLCFFALPAGMMIGFLIVPAIIMRIGLRRACAWSGAAFLISFIAPAYAWNIVSLATVLFISGLMVSGIEVSMNAKASEIEHQGKRRIMSRCHGYWSLGAMAGAFLGGALSEAGISFATQQVIIEPIFAVAAFAAGMALPKGAKPRRRLSHGFALPAAALAAICIVPIGALVIEGAMMEWSAILVRDVRGGDAFEASAAFGSFAVAMAVGRLTGDRLTDQFGVSGMLWISAILSALGIFCFSQAAGPYFAIPAAVLVGLGIANVYPIAMSLAALAKGAPERNVASVAFVAFSAFLVGPPLIGVLSTVFGLPVALALLAPLGLVPILPVALRRLPYPTTAE